MPKSGKKRKRDDEDEATIEKVKKPSKKHKKKKKSKRKSKEKEVVKVVEEQGESTDIPISLMHKAMAPMTKEEWEKRQSVIRKVYDEASGRYRLIKGDGEVIEEIVSRDRHQDINRQATRGDGQYFQKTVNHK